MSTDTESNFHDEFIKLTNAMKEVTEGDGKLNTAICKYVDAYGKTVRSKHEELFTKIFDDNYTTILTEAKRGSWLLNPDNEVKIVFAKGKAGAYLPFSLVYRKAELQANANAPARLMTKPLTPLYPNIIILHLYRIFNLLRPDDNLKRKIKIIENELRGKSESTFDISSIASSLIDTARKNVPKKYLPLVDQVASLTTSENMNKIMGNLTELSEAGQYALPEITKGIESISKGEKDIMSVFQDVITNPNVSKKLGGVKDSMKDVLKVMKDKGYEFTPELEEKFNNSDFGDVFKTLMEQGDVKDDLQFLNSSVSKLMGASSSTTDEEANPLVEKLKQLPPEQLQLLLSNLEKSE